MIQPQDGEKWLTNERGWLTDGQMGELGQCDRSTIWRTVKGIDEGLI